VPPVGLRQGQAIADEAASPWGKAELF